MFPSSSAAFSGIKCRSKKFLSQKTQKRHRNCIDEKMSLILQKCRAAMRSIIDIAFHLPSFLVLLLLFVCNAEWLRLITQSSGLDHTSQMKVIGNDYTTSTRVIGKYILISQPLSASRLSILILDFFSIS